MVGEDTDYLLTTFTLTDNIVEGNDYNFKVRSKNIYGWGDYSSLTTIKASAVPAEPAILTTSIVGTNLKFDFATPLDNGGDITAYEVMIL